jgi:hypothetical protein
MLVDFLTHPIVLNSVGLAVLALTLSAELKYLGGHPDDVFGLEVGVILNEVNESIASADGFLFISLVTNGELLASLLLRDEQDLTDDILVEFFDDPHLMRGNVAGFLELVVVLMTGGVIIDEGGVEDLALQAKSLLVGVLFVVVIEDTLLFLDLLIVFTHGFVDALDGPLDARVEVVLDVVVAATREAALLQLRADLAPLVRVLPEESEQHLVLRLRPLSVIAQNGVEMVLPPGIETRVPLPALLIGSLHRRLPRGDGSIELHGNGGPFLLGVSKDNG